MQIWQDRFSQNCFSLRRDDKGKDIVFVRWNLLCRWDSFALVSDLHFSGLRTLLSKNFFAQTGWKGVFWCWLQLSCHFSSKLGLLRSKNGKKLPRHGCQEVLADDQQSLQRESFRDRGKNHKQPLVIPRQNDKQVWDYVKSVLTQTKVEVLNN